MTLENKIKHVFHGNNCIICMPVSFNNKSASSAGQNAADGKDENMRKCCKNILNCDIFMDENNFLMYADIQLFRFKTERTFDVKDIKKLVIKFNSKDSCYEVKLPCLPASEGTSPRIPRSESISQFEKPARPFSAPEHLTNLWNLRRITKLCTLQIDELKTLHAFEANFDYGFASKYNGKFDSEECQISTVCRVPEPHLSSPLQRSIDREFDELKDFSSEQYKLNFVELQVPEGHENPMKYVINFDDSKLNRQQQFLLHNIIFQVDGSLLPPSYDPLEIDCGLISILLSICFDVRCSENDPGCESGWVRTILSAMLSYFEPFNSIKEVVIAFIRRALIYPLYRNYDLARMCVEDAIKALQKRPEWILKQLIVTRQLFQDIDNNREIYNRFYIDDYIRFIKDENYCSTTHLQMLGHNLKNVLLDVLKKHLRLNLAEIETELLKELVNEMHVEDIVDEESEEDTGEDDDEDDDDENNENEDDDDGGTESGEDEDESDTSTDTEENSVIEQRLNDLKL